MKEKSKVLAYDLYKKGMSIEEIAKILGISANTIKVTYLVKETKINKKMQELEKVKTIIRMKNERKTIEYVSEELNIPIKKMKTTYWRYSEEDIENIKRNIEEEVKRNEIEVEQLRDIIKEKEDKETQELEIREKTEELRERIKELYEDKSIEEIALVTGQTREKINAEIKVLLRYRVINEKLRNKMKKCYQQGMRTTKILSSELGAHEATVVKIKRELRKKGELQKYDEIIERLKELYYLQKTDEEISKILEIPIYLVVEIIKNLIICKEICTKEEMEKIRELITDERSKTEINQEVFIDIKKRNNNDIRLNEYLRVLKKQGIITEAELERIEKKQKEKRREEKEQLKITTKRIEELYDRRKTDEEIAEILDIEIEQVSIIKKELFFSKIICTREEIEQIQELYRKGRPKKEIAQIVLNLNYANKTVNKYIGMAIEEELEDYKMKFEDRQIEIKDLEDIKNTVLTSKNVYKNSLWFLKVLVTFKQFKSAEEFIEQQFLNDKLTEEEQIKIRQQKGKIVKIWRSYQMNRQNSKRQKPAKSDEELSL